MRRLLVLALCFLSPVAYATDGLVSRPTEVGPRSFSNAKKVMPRVYAGHERDIYCGCPYSGKTMDLDACGYVPRKQAARAARLEWEHVVPAWSIGHQRQCWQAKVDGRQGGRKHCTRTDPEFRRAEGDLVNLVPSVGEVNGDRSHFGFSVWQHRPEPIYGQCETVVDFKRRAVQPRAFVRGEIARIQLYMSQTYQMRLSRQDLRLFCAWARQHPVSDWERLRDRRIVALQGHGNRYVSEPGAVDERCG